MRKRNAFGNFDEKRRKFGDPLVYCTAAFFFSFFVITTTVSFFSALAPYKHSWLLVSNGTKMQKQLKIFSRS